MTRATLVVPCYNEAARLDMRAFSDFLGGNEALSVLFVDDGSTDATAERLEALRRERPERVEILSLEANQGKAEAVRRGMLRAFEAGAPYAGYWDADLATPLGAVFDLARVLDTQPNVDLVFGARVQLLGRRIERSAVRHYLGRAFATVASMLLRIPVYDTQCGAKLMRGERGVPQLFESPFLSRWVFDVEIVARLVCAREGSDLPGAVQAIYEHPLREWRDVRGSKVRPWDFVVALKDLLRIHRHYLRDVREGRRGASARRVA